jgi:hypothetical protein
MGGMILLTARGFLSRPPTGTPRRAISPGDGLLLRSLQYHTFSLKGVAGLSFTARIGRHKCSLQARSLSLQGWGLIDLPLRASHEGSPRPRVARAQKIIRLHPLPFFSILLQLTQIETPNALRRP